MKHTVIQHGVGAGWNDGSLLQISNTLGVDYLRIKLIHYADKLEKSWWNNLIPSWLFFGFKPLIEGEDAVDDVLSYFLDKKVRESILDNCRNEIKEVLRNHKEDRPITLVFHSLGSVVGLETLAEMEEWYGPNFFKHPPNVFLIGSPWALKLVRLFRGLHWRGKEWPKGAYYILAGDKDPVAAFGRNWVEDWEGDIIVPRTLKHFFISFVKIKGQTHNLFTYLRYIRMNFGDLL